MTRIFAISAAVTCLLSSFTHAHMEMSSPFPIRSSLDPTVPGNLMDYNYKSPLDASGSNYPCHGYQNDRPIQTKAQYKAGSKYTMTIKGSASHGGGSCQLSLSYDNGATFKVIKSMIGNCPVVNSYDFTIPTFAPSGNALFAWTWFNEIGNREMYMNCAWVQIQGSSQSRIKKRQTQYTSMSALPNIWRANIKGLNNCTTTEGTDPHFQNLGPDTIYGLSRSASDAVTLPDNGCDASAPFGQTYKNLGDTSPVDTGSSGPGPSSPQPGVPSRSPSKPSRAAPVFAEGASSQTPSASVSMGGVFAEVGAVTATVSMPTSTGTANLLPMGATSLPTISVLNNFQTAAPTTLAAVASPSAPAPIATPVAAVQKAPASNLAYATTETMKSFIPCIPGAFICISATQYHICDQSTDGIPFHPSQRHVGPITVAAGMKCEPFAADIPSGSTVQGSSLALDSAGGWFRSDRYVAA